MTTEVEGRRKCPEPRKGRKTRKTEKMDKIQNLFKTFKDKNKTFQKLSQWIEGKN